MQQTRSRAVRLCVRKQLELPGGQRQHPNSTPAAPQEYIIRFTTSFITQGTVNKFTTLLIIFINYLWSGRLTAACACRVTATRHDRVF